MTQMKRADAEVAKRTGGMLALRPRAEDAVRFTVPGGEPLEDLHVTLVYAGEDVTHLPHPVEALSWLDAWLEGVPAIEARVFAHATFNPDTYAGREPCAVYLVGDNPVIGNLHHDAAQALGSLYDLPSQHAPYHAHMTAKYGARAADLTEVGDITFDRVTLEWAGESYVYPLLS